MLYYWEVTLSLLRVLKMLADCQRKSAPDVYVAYTVRSQDTGKLFTTELGQFPTCGPPFCHEEGLKTGLTLVLLLSILIFLWWHSSEALPGLQRQWTVGDHCSGHSSTRRVAKGAFRKGIRTICRAPNDTTVSLVCHLV